jgi:hypothetical protein
MSDELRPQRPAAKILVACAVLAAVSVGCDRTKDRASIQAPEAVAPGPDSSTPRWAGLYRAQAEEPSSAHYLELEVKGPRVGGVYTGVTMDYDFQAWFQAPIEQVTTGPDGALSFVVGRRILHLEPLSPKARVNPADEGAGYAATPLTFVGALRGDVLELTCAPADDCSTVKREFARIDPGSVP